MELPLPSTLTMPPSSLFDLDDLTVAQIFRNLRHQRVSLGHACQDFDVLSPLGSERHRPELHFAVVYQEHACFSVLLMYGRAWDQRLRRGGPASWGGAGLLLAQKHNLDAHVRQDSRVELVKRDANFHGCLLAVRRWNNCSHMGWNLPIGIRVQGGGHLLPL